MSVHYRVLGVGLLALALGGCANYATLMDPETVPKGKFQMGYGATFTNYSLETTTVDASGETTKTTEDFTVPALTFTPRIGLTDNLEIHAMVWIPFGATIGAKLMLAGDREKGGFVFSPGLDIGYLSVSVNDVEQTFIDIYVPLNMGYRTGESFAVYFTPKYVLRLISGEQSETGHVAGGTVGIALGKDFQFLVEGGFLYDTLVETPIIQGGLGIAFM